VREGQFVQVLASAESHIKLAMLIVHVVKDDGTLVKLLSHHLMDGRSITKVQGDLSSLHNAHRVSQVDVVSFPNEVHQIIISKS
jgi:hypothetical protein